jgi:hypothetical protein
MHSTETKGLVAGAVALAVLVLAPAAATAGDSGFQAGFGGNFFETSPPCPFKEFPTFESIAPIPAIIDPFDQDLIPLFCQIRVKKNGNPVAKAKGTFESTLFVLDNNTGEFETFGLGSGKFKTNSDGFDEFDFEIPAPIFADGFESGDVSAWSYTRAEGTKKKKVEAAQLDCFTQGSK